MVVLGFRTNLFKMDDSRAKSITDFRSIEVSAIRIAKRMGKISYWGGRPGLGCWRSGTRDCCFFLFACFKSINTSKFKLWAGMTMIKIILEIMLIC